MRKGRKVRFICPWTWRGRWNISYKLSPELYTRLLLIFHIQSSRLFSQNISPAYFRDGQVDWIFYACRRINFHRAYITLYCISLRFPENTSVVTSGMLLSVRKGERERCLPAGGHLEVLWEILQWGNIPSGQLRSSLMRLRRDVARDLTKFVKRHKEESLIAFSSCLAMTKFVRPQSNCASLPSSSFPREAGYNNPSHLVYRVLKIVDT